MLFRLSIVIISLAVLVCLTLILVIGVRANYDLSLMKAAFLADLGHRAMPLCSAEAQAKGIKINAFSAMTPDSVSFALERGVGEKTSRLGRIFEFSREPEKFVGWIRVMIDVSDLESPVYCAFNLWSGDVDILGVPTASNRK